MPLIHCPKCGQAYDVPGVVSVRLQNAIATCHCGEWLAGSKAAVLARLLRPDEIKEIDLQPYRVDKVEAKKLDERRTDPGTMLRPRSLRIIAQGAKETIDSVFIIAVDPLYIGRKGCHIELAEADLSLRHCSIFVRGADLVVRDLDSHMGTFLNGEKISEAVIPEGTHLLRMGSAIVSVEPTEELGKLVEPIRGDLDEYVDEAAVLQKLQDLESPPPRPSSTGPKRFVLVCIDGSLNGQEFEVPPKGLVVGREGHVRVPDEFLSRRHFEVVPDDEGNIRVRDLGSRNGTFLNTLPAQNTKITEGDEIRAGVNRFRIDVR